MKNSHWKGGDRKVNKVAPALLIFGMIAMVVAASGCLDGEPQDVPNEEEPGGEFEEDPGGDFEEDPEDDFEDQEEFEDPEEDPLG